MTILRSILPLTAIVCLFASGCATSTPPKQDNPIIGREYSAEIPTADGGAGKRLSLKIEAAKVNDQIVSPQSMGGVELIEFNQALVARLATNSFIATIAANSSSPNQPGNVRISIEFAGSENFHAGETSGKAAVVGLTLGLAGPFVKHPYSYSCTITLNCFIGDRVDKFTATGTIKGEYVNSKMVAGFRSVRNAAREEAIRQIINQLH